MKSPGKTWASVSDGLDVGQQHLSRVARRVTGIHLGELGLRSTRELADRFLMELSEAGLEVEIEP